MAARFKLVRPPIRLIPPPMSLVGERIIHDGPAHDACWRALVPSWGLPWCLMAKTIHPHGPPAPSRPRPLRAEGCDPSREDGSHEPQGPHPGGSTAPPSASSPDSSARIARPSSLLSPALRLADAPLRHVSPCA